MIKASNLITDRLILRDIVIQDTELIVKWRSNPDIYKYFLNPYPLSKEEHLKWYYNNYISNSNRFDFIAIRKDTKKAIGVFGIKRSDYRSRQAEVSYILSPEEQGKGYASEAILKLLNYIKIEWKCEKATAVIHKHNQISIQFAEKLGYRCVDHKGIFGIYEREL